jgi:hypothetical protein
MLYLVNLGCFPTKVISSAHDKTIAIAAWKKGKKYKVLLKLNQFVIIQHMAINIHKIYIIATGHSFEVEQLLDIAQQMLKR